MMDLREYQEKARSTAIYLEIENTRILYPALGIISECGEVAGKIKKLIRDDGGDMNDDRRKAISKELGDCCWYLANICCDIDHDLIMMYDMRWASMVHHIRGLTLPQLVLHMSRHATFVAESLEQWYYKYDSHPGARSRFPDIPNNLTNIITCIEEIARRCGFTLEDIYTENIEKLSNRQKKGTIQGSGDNR